MRKLVVAVMLLTLPLAANAEDRQPAKPQPRQVKSNPCAAFGPGFVQVEGTSTCVKVGGGISVGGGIGAGGQPPR
jgi:hypothetical protein